MKPIDIVKEKIDYDLFKYGQSVLCDIKELKWTKGCGLLAEVVITDYYKNLGYGEEAESFNVVIINRASAWIEKDAKDKFYVYLLNPSKSRPFGAMGIMIRKTTLHSFANWGEKMKKEVEGQMKNYIFKPGNF